MIGTTVSRYRIVSKLGGGGMGVVYEAEDPELGRTVAIKFLPEGGRSADSVARFQREARAASALNHPHICTVHDVGEHEGQPFLVMERISGEPLHYAIAGSAMPIERVVALGEQIADALDAAHRAGIVHRDLKPANLFVTERGDAKVLDFGLAKVNSPATSGSVSADAPTVAGEFLTEVGTTLGTIAYMSPEQARGQVVDARSDLFSLGAVLYEMATGRLPFAGESGADLLASILRSAPAPPSHWNRELPAALESILLKALEKDPALRYQSAAELRADLLRLRRDTSAPEREGERPRDTGGIVSRPPPLAPTPLLGREANLERAATLLRDGARLLTVTGYGGTGKTRFTAELFLRVRGDYPGGAAFVSLASVTDPAEVLPTVAQSLEIAEAHGRSALDALATVIGDRPVLLLLDNLEQVLGAAAQVAELVARCPALQVIATSRAPLAVAAETELPLPPLEVPDTGDVSLDALRECPSVALFLQRAAKVKPGFTLVDDNAAAISAICRRLDGLPLALELAAARVRILEPRALLERLDRALDLLTSGDRDLPLRQRTLRATISWSYSLLDESEKRLLRAVSVFHEGWSLEAMERVCYADDERHRALDELESLVAKGLVRVGGDGGRFALLETVRAFAAEQLHASGEVDAVERAHTDCFLDFAERAAERILGVGQLAAMADARADHANLHAALARLSANAAAGDAEALEKALRLCGRLDWYWHICGVHMTSRAVLDPLLALAADRPPSRGRALAWLAAGMISTCTGEWERSLDEWARGAADGEAAGDARAAAEGMMGQGYCHLNAGRLPEAAAALDEAIARSEACGFEFMLAISMSLKAMLLHATGDTAAGIALLERAREIQRRIGDCEGGGVALSFLAQMAFAQGEAERALSLYRESLVTLEAVGDRPEIARVLSEMGWTALSQQRPETARKSFRRAVLAYEEVGSPRGTGLSLLGLAAADAAEGLTERAVTIATAARALSERAGVVVDHPMDAGLAARIEALKASIPRETLVALSAEASALSPAAVLAMLAD